MLLLLNNSPSFELKVKNRLYIKNYDALDQTDPEKAREALQNSFILVKDDYRRIIESINKSQG